MTTLRIAQTMAPSAMSTSERKDSLVCSARNLVRSAVSCVEFSRSSSPVVDAGNAADTPPEVGVDPPSLAPKPAARRGLTATVSRISLWSFGRTPAIEERLAAKRAIEVPPAPWILAAFSR